MDASISLEIHVEPSNRSRRSFQLRPCTLRDSAASNLSKRRRPLCNEQLLANALGNAVRKRKFEILGQKLSDVWSLDIRCLLDLNDFQDLGTMGQLIFSNN